MTFDCQLLTANAEPRRVTVDGIEYLVVDGVILTEGVHSANNGAAYYPDAELEKIAPTWNELPVIVEHTKNTKGEFIGARDPAAVNLLEVGFVRNSAHADKRTRFEAWIDVKKANQHIPEVVKKIENKEKVELSSGLFTPIGNVESGSFNGTPYDWTARNIRADHVAILPKSKGACDTTKGCGLNANAACGCKNPTVNSVPDLFTVNGVQISYGDMLGLVRSAVYDKFSRPGYSWNGWVEEVYDGFCIYYNNGDLFRLGYTYSDGTVTVTGSPVEVVRVVSYREPSGAMIGNASNWTFTTNTENGMTTAAKFNSKEHVTNLITNGVVAEADRATLEALDEPALKAIKVPAKTTANTEPATPAAAPPVPEPAARKITMADLPAELRGPVERAIANENARKAQLIAVITANVANRFSPEQLALKDLPEIEALAALAAPPAQPGYLPPPAAVGGPWYGGAGGPPPATANAAPVPVLRLVAQEYGKKAV